MAEDEYAFWGDEDGALDEVVERELMLEAELMAEADHELAVAEAWEAEAAPPLPPLLPPPLPPPLPLQRPLPAVPSPLPRAPQARPPRHSRPPALPAVASDEVSNDEERSEGVSRYIAAAVAAPAVAAAAVATAAAAASTRRALSSNLYIGATCSAHHPGKSKKSNLPRIPYHFSGIPYQSEINQKRPNTGMIPVNLTHYFIALIWPEMPVKA
jgi:hypothetical protein